MRHRAHDRATPSPARAAAAAAAAALALMALGLQACVSVYRPPTLAGAARAEPEHPSQGDTLSIDAWPARVPVRNTLRQLRAATPEPATGQAPRHALMGVPIRLSRPVTPMRRTPQILRRIEQELTADALLLSLSRLGPVLPGRTQVRSEGRGSFLFVSTDEPAADPRLAPAAYYKFVSGRVEPLEPEPRRAPALAQPALPQPPADLPAAVMIFEGLPVAAEPGGGGQGGAGPDIATPGTPTPRASTPSAPDADTPDPAVVIQLQRTWFSFYAPLASGADPEPRGLIVLLPGVFGTPADVIDAMVHQFRGRGWAVLRMLSHPSRFTERRAYRVSPDDPSPAARAIAREMSDRAAECAYAVEGVLSHVILERPGLARAPRVLVGMSGGALVLPTVLARDPAAWSAAVLIGGGADWLSVALRSNYASLINAFTFVWRPDPPEPPGADAAGQAAASAPAQVVPTAAQRQALSDHYLANAPLDPIHTARLLRELPTLFVHASADRAVPADLGDRLWDAAGRPERWSIGVGHELLFLTLPWHAARLADWVGAAALRSPEPAPGPTPAGAPSALGS